MLFIRVLPSCHCRKNPLICRIQPQKLRPISDIHHCSCSLQELHIYQLQISISRCFFSLHFLFMPIWVQFHLISTFSCSTSAQRFDPGCRNQLHSIISSLILYLTVSSIILVCFVVLSPTTTHQNISTSCPLFFLAYIPTCLYQNILKTTAHLLLLELMVTWLNWFHKEELSCCANSNQQTPINLQSWKSIYMTNSIQK